jgi:hypothetical protein
MKIAGFLTCLCACFSLARPALAWNAEGHMIVAQIAYNHLNPALKAQCDALIAMPVAYGSSQNSTFVTSACWADDAKSSLGTGIWHYIDLPFSLDGTPTSGVTVAPFDVVQAINLSIATLQSPSTTQSNKAVSLRYLLHFLGDIHQPLHSSTAVSASSPSGDAGGNGFSINGNWNNLHSLWDSGGGYLTDSLPRPLNAVSQSTLDAKVAAVETDYPYAPNAGTLPNPMDWAVEGRGLAETVAYVGITRNSAPSTTYLNTAQSTTEQRMALGGHRLADLLDTLFAPAPISLTCFTSANGSFGVSWSAVVGRTYSVQWKQQPGDPEWNTVTNVIASGPSASFAESPAQPQRFYRVVQ